jgi:hypothetical protein
MRNSYVSLSALSGIPCRVGGDVLPPPEALELPLLRHLRIHLSDGSILQMHAFHVELLSYLFWAHRSMRHLPRSLRRWTPYLI